MTTEQLEIQIASPERVQLRRRNLTLRRALVQLDGQKGRVLEPGCGYGRFLRALRQCRPELQVHGCDFDPKAIDIARSMDQEISLGVGSITELPYADYSFDAVLVFDVLEHIHNPQKSIEEICRVLKPGGLLHALVPCEGQPFTLHWLLWRLNIAADLKERHGGHVQRFRQRDVQALFSSNGLKITDVCYSMHPIGQVKDILTYIEREDWFSRLHLNNLLYRIIMMLLWPGAYIESGILARLPAGAVAMHVTARKSAE